MESNFTPTENDLTRFWSRVDKSNGLDACWMWTAGLHNRGYGRIRWNGMPECAHRIVWMLINGAIPNELEVLHRCDNPPCCNPGHLFLGTQADNMHDRDAKGRQNPHGQWRVPNARIRSRALPADLHREIVCLRNEINRLTDLVEKLQKVPRETPEEGCN
jgi:hypothetical protein